MTTALCFSGGLDSAAAWWALGKPAWYFVVGGNPHARVREAEAVEALCSLVPEFRLKGRVLDIDFSPFQGSFYYFPRNLLLSFVGVALGYREIWAAFQLWDGGSPRHEVDQRTTELVRHYYSNPELTVSSPTAKWSRTELVRRALEAGCPKEFLTRTWSCHQVEEKHCGLCINCVERYVAFKACGVECEDQYMVHPLSGDGMLKAISWAQKREHSDFVKDLKKAKGIPENEPIYI